MTFVPPAQRQRVLERPALSAHTRPFDTDARLAVLLIAAILIYWTDILRILFPAEDAAPSTTFRLLNFAFYGLYIALLATMPWKVLSALRAAPLLFLFLALPAISVVWSTMPGETLQRAVAVTGSSLLGVYLALALSLRNSVRIVAFAAFLAAIGSFITIALVPAIGIMSVEHPGAWAGLYSHKNGLGQMAALGALLALAVVLADGSKRNPWALMSMALNTVLVIGSRSLTALILLVVVACALIFVGRFVRFIIDNSLFLLLGLAPLVLLAVANFQIDDVFVLLAAAGKDGNLSSRLPMWQALLPFMEDRFWLGWGYEAFWHQDNYAVRIVEAKLYFRPFYAHNGIIELWLSLGAVGVGTFLVLFATFVRRTLARLYREPARPETLAALAFAFIFVLQNISESTILMRHSMSWTIFVTLYLALAFGRASENIGQLASPAQRNARQEAIPQATAQATAGLEPSPFKRAPQRRKITIE